MTHEERLGYIKRMNWSGLRMIAGCCGAFGGLCGGLWIQMGAGAIGVGFGGASGLLFGSCGPFSQAKEYKKWDAEAGAGNGTDKV